MNFPVEILGMHPHRVFDVLAFAVAGQLFWWQARRDKGPPLERGQRLAIAFGCAVGGAFGAKLIVMLEDPAATFAHINEWNAWLTGKSIVGGLLGGIVGVEIAKAHVGVTRSTGDLFALPLAVGIAIGRIGCFLTGLPDATHGDPTALVWGVDFGDGVARHPTQLYEAGFALLLATAILVVRRRAQPGGDLFRMVLAGYLAFRFLEEFIRPAANPYLGLTIYQIAALAGIAYALRGRAARARLARLVTGRVAT